LPGSGGNSDQYSIRGRVIWMQPCGAGVAWSASLLSALWGLSATAVSAVSDGESIAAHPENPENRPNTSTGRKTNGLTMQTSIQQ
jgi:hypothetical protein